MLTQYENTGAGKSNKQAMASMATNKGKGGKAANGKESDTAVKVSSATGMPLLQKPQEYVVSFRFPDPPELPPPYIQLNDVEFQYENGPKIFSKVNLGVWPSSRIAIVGANGAGKSTLLNLLTGDLAPSAGQVCVRARTKDSP